MINKYIVEKIGRNEISHMSVSLNIALIVSLLTNWQVGLVVGFLAGLTKEISDGLEKNNIFSFRDMFYNAIGLLAALIVLNLL